MSSIMKGIVDEGDWTGGIINWKKEVTSKHGPDVTFKKRKLPGVNGKTDTYATNSEGKVVGVYQHHNDMGRVLSETDAIKGADGKRCWKGKRYAGTENGKDKCIPVKEESDEEALERLKKNKSKEKWMADADLEYMRKRHDKKKIDELSPETMLKYRKKADDDANYADATGDDARFDKRVKGVMSANRLLRNKKTTESAYEKDLSDNEPRTVIGVYGAKSKEFRKKFRNQTAQDRFFDHPDREGNYEIHYVQKLDEGVFDLLKKKPSPSDNMRERLHSMSTDELRRELKDYKPRLSGARASGQLVGAAVSDYVNAIQSELDKRAFNDFSAKNPDWDKDMNEGVIVGHDANDPEVAIFGGAGTMSLSRLKKKAQGEAEQLANDLARGRFKAAAYNIKQLENTLKTIAAAEDEMSKKYFGEGIFDKFKKKLKKPELNLPRYPNSNDANEWMEAKADYYAQYDPGSLPNLFSPASGDYLPLTVHVGSSWKPEHQAFYRELKKKYPKAVEQAKEMTTGIAGRVSLSRVGDPQDFHGMSISNEDYTGEFATEKTAAVNPYGGLKDRQFRSAIGEGIQLAETPDTSGPVGTQPGGWRRTDLDEYREMSPALKAAQANLRAIKNKEKTINVPGTREKSVKEPTVTDKTKEPAIIAKGGQKVDPEMERMMADFLARGGVIKKGRPGKAPPTGRNQASKHIGGGGKYRKKSDTPGQGANYRGDKIVAVEAEPKESAIMKGLKR